MLLSWLTSWSCARNNSWDGISNKNTCFLWSSWCKLWRKLWSEFLLLSWLTSWSCARNNSWDGISNKSTCFLRSDRRKFWSKFWSEILLLPWLTSWSCARNNSWDGISNNSTCFLRTVWRQICLNYECKFYQLCKIQRYNLFLARMIDLLKNAAFYFELQTFI